MDPFFHYHRGELYCEEVAISTLLRQWGSPLYVYSANALRENFRKIQQALSPLQPKICYSVKANSHLAILELLRREGAYFDVVSLGELLRVEASGASAKRAVFAGVGKTEEELRQSLQKGLFLFTVESLEEARLLHEVALSEKKVAPVLFRLNPDVEAQTHRYISTGKREHKFGIPSDVLQYFLRHELPQLSGLVWKGIHVHIGSQIRNPENFRSAVEKVKAFLETLAPLPESVEYFDLGGGFGIDYERAEGTDWQSFGQALLPVLEDLGLGLLLEPGRSIAALAGVLITTILYRKQGATKVFWIVDSGMHHLIRPTLYEAHHPIWPVQASESWLEAPQTDLEQGDVVGPICETGDFLGLERRLPKGLQRGDALAVFGAGAYGASMASTYNSHRRPAEVLVDGDRYFLISRREEYSELWKREILTPYDSSFPHLE